MKYYCSHSELDNDQSFGFCSAEIDAGEAEEAENIMPILGYLDEKDKSETQVPPDDYQLGVRRMWVHIWSVLLPVLVVATCVIPFWLFGGTAADLSEAWTELASSRIDWDFFVGLAEIPAFLGLLVIPYQLSIRATASQLRIFHGWKFIEICVQIVSVVLYIILTTILWVIYQLLSEKFFPSIVNEILQIVVCLIVGYFFFIAPVIQLMKAGKTAAFMKETRHQRKAIVKYNDKVVLEEFKSTLKRIWHLAWKTLFAVLSVLSALLEAPEREPESEPTDNGLSSYEEHMKQLDDDLIIERQNREALEHNGF